jgi:phage terminase large subunit
MYEVDFSDLGEMLNDWIKNIWNDRNRYIVAKGGGGSGKSYGVCQLNVYRCIAEPGHRYLVVRKVAKTIRESIFQLIQEIISSYGCMSLFTINKSDMTISCVNGNKFIFAGLDDVEKLKSIQGITDIIIEEASELEPGDYRQLDIRLEAILRMLNRFLLCLTLSA